MRRSADAAQAAALGGTAGFVVGVGFFIADGLDSLPGWIAFTSAGTIDFVWRLVDEYRERRDRRHSAEMSHQ